MKPIHGLVLCALGMSAPIITQAADFNNWPTKLTTTNGSEWSLTGNYQYDAMHVRHSDTIEDAHTNRRKELGGTVRKKNAWDAMVYFDFQSKTWLDVFLRVDSAWILGKDYGKFRFGHTKLPVGFEGITGSRAYSFAEMALPMHAFYQSRRTGIDWALERPDYLVNLGYYFAQDLQGNNDGNTIVARTAWTPFKSAGDVLHLGISASRERPSGTTDGRGVHRTPSARWRARPEAGLTDVRLVDSGSLSDVDSNRRIGLEGLWIRGPWSLQGEYLQVHTKRAADLSNYSADGYYMFGSYVLTGESRTYAGGNVGNLKPQHPWGAVELLVRYSAVDLNHNAIQGGRKHDLTFGANWYLTQHFKFQANYVKVRASRQGQRQNPDIVIVRAQVYF
ncbi:OprO/OprP family phosphate-selective porin [Dyella sp. 20L07]|uniref:OprO/OprP family phosphate-selective porin n=1 Tax=Dyella sp. 20L07 TaxID=3384240 RepID=UPI003D294F1A